MHHQDGIDQVGGSAWSLDSFVHLVGLIWKTWFIQQRIPTAKDDADMKVFCIMNSKLKHIQSCAYICATISRHLLTGAWVGDLRD